MVKKNLKEVSGENQANQGKDFIDITNFMIKFKFLRNLSWQDYVFIALLILVISYNFNTVSKLKQLPGPLYGGDIYFHFGNVMHVNNGGSVFKSSHYLNEYQHYPWLMYVLVWIFSKLFFINILRADILFPIVILFFSMLTTYIAGKLVFKNKTLALLFSIGFLQGVPLSVPTSFYSFVLLPFLIIIFYLIRNDNLSKQNTRKKTHKKILNLKNLVIAGVLYGLCGIGHVAAFLSTSLFLLLLLFYELLNKRRFFDVLKKYLVVFFIGVSISLLYWAPLIFVYHGKTLNPWQEYAFMGTQGKSTFIIKSLVGTFFSFSSFYQVILTLLVFLGILSLFAFRSDRNVLLMLLFATGFLGIIHPYITEPLIHTSFGYYGFSTTLSLFRITLGFSGLLLVYKLLKNRTYRVILFTIFLIVFLLNIRANVENFKTNKWTKIGFEVSPLMNAQFEFANFVLKSTAQNDVLITPHGETAFAINALTGRKVVFMRRTHASPFVDVDKRIADAAVMLYGNNSNLRKELLKKYNVKYLYTDYYSEQSIINCLQVWDNLTNPNFAEFSYSCLRTSPKYEEYLKSNGLEVKKVHARLDVASNLAPKFDLIVIKPSSLKLNLTELKAYTYNNITYFGLYKINN